LGLTNHIKRVKKTKELPALRKRRKAKIEPLEPRRLPLSGRNIDVHGDGPACGKSTRPQKSSEEAETACFEKEFHGNFAAPQAIPVKKFQDSFAMKSLSHFSLIFIVEMLKVKC
jgi:hypothetical protein